jgi:hypothetical protein
MDIDRSSLIQQARHCGYNPIAKTLRQQVANPLARGVICRSRRRSNWKSYAISSCQCAWHYLEVRHRGYAPACSFENYLFPVAHLDTAFVDRRYTRFPHFFFLATAIEDHNIKMVAVMGTSFITEIPSKPWLLPFGTVVMTVSIMIN